MKYSIFFCLVCGLLSLPVVAQGTASPLPVDGRTTIPGSASPAGPYEITRPGSYLLTGDRLCSGDGVRINADDVTLDLMGFTLTGSGAGENYGIEMNGRRNIEIRNGTIRGFGCQGIHDKNAAGTAFGKRIINMRVAANGKCGICFGGAGNLIKDCTVFDNKGTGLCTEHAVVTGCVFVNNTTGGIACGDGSVVTHNMVYKTEKAGIFSRAGCVIRENTVGECGNSGIYADCAAVIEGNTACGNNLSKTPDFFAGIRVVCDCLVRGNALRGNLQNNVYLVRSGNVVEGNLAAAPQNTQGNGFFFKTKENHFAGNKASGNTTDFAGELPTGPGDGGGNVSILHLDPPAPAPPAPQPAAQAAAAASTAPSPANTPGDGKK